MKTINYTGSSKLISRIVNLLNRKAPLPLDGGGDPSWGTNGQVLTTDGTGNTSWTTPQGGGGDVTDVEVNGTSVVDAQGVANVTVPTATSDLNNDSDFIDSTDLSTALADYTPTASLASVATSGQYSDLSGTPSLATVATSGDYDDLTNKPTIPAAQVNSDWNAASGVAQILNKPTIPTVNDGTLTIQQNGTTVGTFTANQSGNTTVNLTGGGSTYTEGDGINISAQNAISVDTAFTEASTRANIASGDTLATIWGKIKKFFTDLKTVAFTGSYNDLTDKPSVPGGENYVLKAGDTMTGVLRIQSGTDTPLRLRSNHASAVFIALENNTGTTIGFLYGYSTNNENRGGYYYAGSYHDFAYKSEIPDISTKVSKSGDTMTGTLTVNAASDTPLRIKRTNTNGYVYLLFSNSDGNLGFYAVGTDKKPYFEPAGGADERIPLQSEIDAKNFIKDVGNGVNTTFAYSKSGLALSDLTWLAGWNGYELRAVNKSNFITTANIGSQSVSYATSAGSATSAGNADTVDGKHLDWSNGGNVGTSVTYLAAWKDDGTLIGWVKRSDISVGHASTASSASSAYYATSSGSAGTAGKLIDGTSSIEVQDAALTQRLVLQSDYNLVLYKNGSSVWQSGTSSRRFKHNIQSMTEERARKILDVRAVTFDWNDGQPVTTQKCDNAGVIAEEVSQIIPDVVVFEQYDNDPNTRIERRVEYERFTPYLIKMVQMQQKQIDTMQATINALEQRLSKLEGK